MTLFGEHHARILDDYFRESFARSEVCPIMGINKNPYAIFATGGYGRGEQCMDFKKCRRGGQVE